MRKPCTRPSDTALFAMLLVDEWADRVLAFDPAQTDDDYLAFLRSQSDTRHDNCYAKALRLIEGRA